MPRRMYSILHLSGLNCETHCDMGKTLEKMTRRLMLLILFGQQLPVSQSLIPLCYKAKQAGAPSKQELINPKENDQGRKGPCFFQRLIALKCLKCQKIQNNI